MQIDDEYWLYKHEENNNTKKENTIQTYSCVYLPMFACSCLLIFCGWFDFTACYLRSKYLWLVTCNVDNLPYAFACESLIYRCLSEQNIQHLFSDTLINEDAIIIIK